MNDEQQKKNASGGAIRVFTGGMAATNGYVYPAPEGPVAIDAPEDMAAWLAGEGIVPGALLLTHVHFDHIMDAAKIAREHGCPVYSFGPTTPEGTLEAYFGPAGLDFTVEPFECEAFLEGKSEVTVLGATFRILHVPGHSPDSLCFVADGDPDADSDAAVCFDGDVLMAGGIGRSDFPNSDPVALVTGIREKLFALDDDVVLYPGHGPATTIGVERAMNPFVGEGAELG